MKIGTKSVDEFTSLEWCCVLYWVCEIRGAPVLVLSCTSAFLYWCWCCPVLVLSCTGAVLYWCCPVLVLSCTGVVLYWCCPVLVLSCTSRQLLLHTWLQAFKGAVLNSEIIVSTAKTLIAGGPPMIWKGGRGEQNFLLLLCSDVIREM